MKSKITHVLAAAFFGLLTFCPVTDVQVSEADENKEERPARLSEDIVFERLMGFDKNQDGKLIKDELPERLQPMIERGDQNKDGALDNDEVRNLAKTPRPIDDRSNNSRREAAPVNLERVIDDLQVRGEKRRAARSAVQAHQDNVRKFIEKSQQELLEKVKNILSDEEYKEFKAALENNRPGQNAQREGERRQSAEPNREEPKN